VDNRRNLMTAVMLSLLAILVWSWLAERYGPKPDPNAAKPVAGAPATPGATGGSAPGTQAGAIPGVAGTSTALRPLDQVITQAGRLAVETPRLKGSINLKGARLDDLVLSTYRDTIKKDSPPVRLLSPEGAKGAHFAGLGWTGQGVAVPDANTVWTADAAKLTPATPVTLSWANTTGQTFRIRLSVDDKFMFSAEQLVVNAGTGAVAVTPYGFITRDDPAIDPSFWTNHIGPTGVFNGKADYETDYSDLDGGETPARQQSTGGWLGMGDKYWLTALVPDQSSKMDGGFRAANGMYQADFVLPQTLLAPGKQLKTNSRIFAGAKEFQLLEDYEAAGVAKFGAAIDWGWFEIIEVPMFKLLDWLFTLVKNFGVAIILLTLIVRGLMYPVAQRQFASMAAMRAVQPKMQELQERYKEDKPRLQKEMMALYQKEKINPMAGCLPIFLQMPIFYGLYKVLIVSVEMRHQPFALWVQDLSAPDSATILNLFGLLPFDPPGFLAIGILPVLVGVTMFLQFKLNPPPPDPIQAQMFSIMPWVLMFIMAPFAAGLQLYWVVSNLLSIVQQKLLYAKHPQLKTPAPPPSKPAPNKTASGK
jgi:YidC/Oxa1 family membrane protein insertase